MPRTDAEIDRLVVAEWTELPEIPEIGVPVLVHLGNDFYDATLHYSERMPDQLIWHMNGTDFVAVDHPLIHGWKYPEEDE